MRPTCAYCGETLQNNGFEKETGYCSEECLQYDIDRDREFDEVEFDTLREAAEEGRDYTYEIWDR